MKSYKEIRKNLQEISEMEKETATNYKVYSEEKEGFYGGESGGTIWTSPDLGYSYQNKEDAEKPASSLGGVVKNFSNSMFWHIAGKCMNNETLTPEEKAWKDKHTELETPCNEFDKECFSLLSADAPEIRWSGSMKSFHPHVNFYEWTHSRLGTIASARKAWETLKSMPFFEDIEFFSWGSASDATRRTRKKMESELMANFARDDAEKLERIERRKKYDAEIASGVRERQIV